LHGVRPVDGVRVDLNAVRPLFDATWYLAQYPDVARAGCDPFRHYLERGAWEMRNPNPLFDSDWYLETYPEAARSGLNPLAHYQTRGADENYDPHPLFDARTYREVCGRLPRHVSLLEAFLSGARQSCAGAYPSAEALAAVQQSFLDGVTVATVADRRRTVSPWAVFLQCGRPSRHPRWLTASPKPWHLIANFYDDTYNVPIEADLVLAQNRGTKFTAVYRLMEDDPGFFDAYEYVLFLDDDILMTEDAITRLFTLAQTLSLKLAQPAVAPGSANTWPMLLRRGDTVGRYLNAVEIMMPLISREALTLGGHLFGRSISGWGLDFALGDVVSRAFGARRIAVIDAISFRHDKPIDVVGGAYYRMLREHRISPLVEERMMGLRYGAKGPIESAGDSG
jgi:hypothetical protein